MNCAVLTLSLYLSLTLTLALNCYEFITMNAQIYEICPTYTVIFFPSLSLRFATDSQIFNLITIYSL